MEIREYVEELMYPEGGTTSKGEKTMLIELKNGEKVWASPSGKAIWIVHRKKTGKIVKHSIPVSQLISPKLASIRDKQGNVKRCIQFRMIAGMYNNATYGKKYAKDTTGKNGVFHKKGDPIFPKRFSMKSLTDRLDRIEGKPSSSSPKSSYSGGSSLQ